MIVATVYSSKPGSLWTPTCDPSDYKPEHVHRLRDAFHQHLSVPHEFVCLSDCQELDPEILRLPLMHDWGGWWSKLELFAWDWSDQPVLYCDLDNVVLGDLGALADRNELSFYMARDWDYPVPNSSLMWFRGDYRWIYEAFCVDPIANAQIFTKMPDLGDQAFMARALAAHGITPRFWQHELPGFFTSRWQPDAEGAKMILWHGSPKPWQL